MAAYGLFASNMYFDTSIFFFSYRTRKTEVTAFKATAPNIRRLYKFFDMYVGSKDQAKDRKGKMVYKGNISFGMPNQQVMTGYDLYIEQAIINTMVVKTNVVHLNCSRIIASTSILTLPFKKFILRTEILRETQKEFVEGRAPLSRQDITGGPTYLNE